MGLNEGIFCVFQLLFSLIPAERRRYEAKQATAKRSHGGRAGGLQRRRGDASGLQLGISLGRELVQLASPFFV